MIPIGKGIAGLAEGSGGGPVLRFHQPPPPPKPPTKTPRQHEWRCDDRCAICDMTGIESLELGAPPCPGMPRAHAKDFEVQPKPASKAAQRIRDSGELGSFAGLTFRDFEPTFRKGQPGLPSELRDQLLNDYASLQARQVEKFLFRGLAAAQDPRRLWSLQASAAPSPAKPLGRAAKNDLFVEMRRAIARAHGT